MFNRGSFPKPQMSLEALKEIHALLGIDEPKGTDLIEGSLDKMLINMAKRIACTQPNANEQVKK